MNNSHDNSASNAPTLDGKFLHHRFISLAKNRKLLLNKMLAMLPDIYESGIYRKYAKNIFDYAGRFGNIGQSTVEKRLRIEKYLKDKPAMRKAIESAGVHKVALLVRHTTTENDAAMADKTNMSKSAVVKLAKELDDKKLDSENLNLFNLGMSPTNNSAPCRAAAESIKIELNGDLMTKFLKLKKKFNKTDKEILELLVDQALDDAFASKTESFDTAESNGKNLHKKLSPVTESDKSSSSPVTDSPKSNKPVTRYIPAAIKRAVKNKSNQKCAYPGCYHPGEVLHHTERFAANKNHDHLVYLCKTHHEFAHNGLIENELIDVNDWKLDLASTLKKPVDSLYRSYRQI